MFFFGLKFMAPVDFQCVFYSYNSEKTGKYAKKHNTGRWDPLNVWHSVPMKAELKHSTSGPIVLNTRQENLSNAGFFFTGKYYSIKVCLSQENISLELKTNVLFSLISGKIDETTCFHCRVTLGKWKSCDSAWQEHARWSPSCIYVSHIKDSVRFKQFRNSQRVLSVCVCVFTIASAACASKQLNELMPQL